MSLLPPLSQSRFREVGQDPATGYLLIEDCLQPEPLLGRKLPRLPALEACLRQWMLWNHPQFLALRHVVVAENNLLVVMEKLSATQPFNNKLPTRLTKFQLFRHIADLIGACHFLSEHNIHYPSLDLTKIMITADGMRIIGHETAQILSPGLDDGLGQLDVRYAAPELIGQRQRSIKSEIYHLGALLYHFFSGTALNAGGSNFDPKAIPRKWAGLIRPLLQRMLHDLPAQRPDWTELNSWLRQNRALPDHVSPICLQAEAPSQVHWLQGRLAAARSEARMVLIQSYPGRKHVVPLLPFAQKAETEGFAVFHLECAALQSEPFGSINRLVSLLKHAVLPRLERPDLTATLKPFSQWSSHHDEEHESQNPIRDVLAALVPHYCNGFVFLIEDLESWDEDSLSMLPRLASWFAQYPFLLVLCCPSFISPHLIELQRQLPLPCDPAPPLSLDDAQVERLFWSPENEHTVLLAKGLGATARNETLLLYWLADCGAVNGKLSQHYQHIWEVLDKTEQFLLQVLACSERRFCLEELGALVPGGKASAALTRLEQIDLIHEDTHGFALEIPSLARFCRNQLSRHDLEALRRRMLDYETARANPDIVQQIQLTCYLDKLRLSPLLKLHEARFFEELDYATLERIERVYDKTQRQELYDHAVLAQLLRGESPQRYIGENLFLAELCKLMRLRGREPEQAAQELFQASTRRTFSGRQRGYLLVIAAESAPFTTSTRILVKALRSFNRIQLDTSLPLIAEWEARLAAATLQMERPFTELIERLIAADAVLAPWLEAWSHWQAGAFEACLAQLEQLVPHLSSHHDLMLRGSFHKLHGNALFRNNLAARASDAYAKAATCFTRIHHQIALERVVFNQASAENLAGMFDASRSHFQSIFQQAQKQQDLLTCCQVLYHLMACDLLQNDTQSFEARFHEHAQLAVRLCNVEERAKGLALRLHQALGRSREQNREDLESLETLLERVDTFNPLLRDEIYLALRLAQFALGVAESPRPVDAAPFTQWRHQLIDFLAGKGSSSFDELVQSIGGGFLGSCHFFLLKQVIEADMLPLEALNLNLARAFERHISLTKAAYGPLLKQRFGQNQGLTPANQQHWDQALKLFEHLSFPPQAHFLQRVLDGLRSIWPFREWGLVQHRRSQWKIAFEESKNGAAVLEYLRWQEGRINEPSTRRFADGQNTHGLLFLPLAPKPAPQSLAFFIHEYQNNQEILHQEPLLRMYTKLLALSLPHYSDDEEGSQNASYGEIIGRSQILQTTLQKIVRFGRSNLNIYISGESGTGKELAARALHRSSERAHKPFRAVNCSHFPDNLVESELFGHVRGAFTSAESNRSGILELVDGGTLFLDEIGDINAKVQSLLLRVFQEGEFCRVGEALVRKVDIRFITATNKKIHDMIDGGLFREDLFFRMVEEEISLPPLRERLEDLPLLAHHFVNKYGQGRKLVLRGDFYERLRQYHWPGNVRELESYMRKLLIHWPKHEELGAAEVIPFLREHALIREPEIFLADHLNQCRGELARERLALYGGNRTQAAFSLGITRQALTKIIERYHLY